MTHSSDMAVLVERLRDFIITWFENRTGFHERDGDGVMSAYYGGNWISFDANKLAQHIAALTKAAPPVEADLREALEKWRLRDGYMPAYIAGWNDMIDQALREVAEACRGERVDDGLPENLYPGHHSD